MLHLIQFPIIPFGRFARHIRVVVVSMSNLCTRYRELEVIVARLISLNHEDADLATKVARLKISALEAFDFKDVARGPKVAAPRKLGTKADVTLAQPLGSS